ncbi:MAG: hypothetical protein KBB94_06515 [Legionellaceae bacterium]|nr:hypothetical protein [Legionellaceae bacterium]MBP9775792.1 hypothetical protein [Legionellaceae bacterium]
MRQNIILITGLSLLSGASVAQSVAIAPQPTSCMDSNFHSVQRAKYRVETTVALTVTNHCGQTVDLQNTSITFLNAKNINTMFWGNFSPLSYPSNPMKITSQPIDDHYLSTLSLQFPQGNKTKTTLPDGASFTVYYAVKHASYMGDSARVYLNSAVNTGNVRILNGSTQPENVSDFYTLVNLRLNGETISSVTIPWSGQQLVSGLAPGVYDVSPVNVDAEDEDHQYEGMGSPTKLTVTSGDTVSAIITYAEKLVMGTIRLQLQDLPAVLTGYSETPKVTMTREDNNSAQIANLQWGNIQDASHLAGKKSRYHFSTADISYNGYTCTPSFEPSAVAATQTKPIVTLSYACVQTSPDMVVLHVEGAPATLSSVKITFTPNGNAAPVTESVALVDGAGKSTLSFPASTIYTVTAADVEGYSASYSANTLTVADGATETIVYTKNTSIPATEPEVAAAPEAPAVTVDATEPEVAEAPEAPAVTVDATEPEVAAEPEALAVTVDATEPEVATEPEALAVTVDATEPEVATEPEALAVTVDATEPEVAAAPEAPAVTVDATEPEVAAAPEAPAVTVDATEPEVATEPEALAVTVDATEPEVAAAPEAPAVTVDATEPEVATEPEAPAVTVDATEPEVAAVKIEELSTVLPAWEVAE